jgi:hypothetical protein
MKRLSLYLPDPPAKATDMALFRARQGFFRSAEIFLRS